MSLVIYTSNTDPKVATFVTEIVTLVTCVYMTGNICHKVVINLTFTSMTHNIRPQLTTCCTCICITVYKKRENIRPELTIFVIIIINITAELAIIVICL